MTSLTAEYALRAVVILGSSPGSPRTTQQIAEQARVPSGYLSKVLQVLSRAGMVESQRGLNGGFVLARPPNDLTVLDVINAVDPLKRIDRCPLGGGEHASGLCPLHRRLDQGIAEMEAIFRETTIAQLIVEQDMSHPLCVMAHHKPERRSGRG
ncbi:MAG: Rrf2 family transcriptional regulator [Isosphaeraceae bacterium]